MPLFRRRRDPQQLLDDRMGAAVSEATQAIGSSAVDDYFAAMLMSCVSAGGAAIQDFVEASRDLGTENSSEPLIVEFIERLDAGQDLIPPLRVSSWAYIARLIAMNWGDRYHEVSAVAEEGFGIESDAERRLASYGPLAGGRDEQVAEFAKFQRIALEAVLEPVIGRPVEEKSETVAANVLWAECFTQNWDVYERMLNHLAPSDPPP